MAKKDFSKPAKSVDERSNEALHDAVEKIAEGLTAKEQEDLKELLSRFEALCRQCAKPHRNGGGELKVGPLRLKVWFDSGQSAYLVPKETFEAINQKGISHDAAKALCEKTGQQVV